MADAATTTNYQAPEGLGTYATRALFVGAVGLALALVVSLLAGGIVEFFRAYLVGFFFVCGLAVGSLAWLMLGHLTGGAWGLVTRRVFEAATRTLPVVFVLFLPVVVALFVHDHGHALYEWTNREAVATDAALRHKSKYLNIPFFIVRAVFYFAIWGLFTYLMNKWSAQQDTTGDPRVRRLMQDVSAPGILLFGLTSTFAAIDWGMSLEPHWFSTIYGLIAMAGWGLSALAFAITIVVMLSEREHLRDVYQPSHLHDLGKLLLAMVMLFAYFAFSQFLIIWAGNLPEETQFYLRRLKGGWQFVGLALILFHFALPFVLLLSRGRKRRGGGLRRVAILMLLMRVVDLIFMFAPASQQGGHEGAAAGIPLRDFLTMALATAGVGGIWLWFFLRELRRRPLLPLGAPDLEKALAATAHH
ncbi:MAG TPA: hypothetical protein VFX96_16225 [Pyrinomonadaceae bacterium]|nr:hypothetical protein [Pyrinomonadaceae bacterium]